MVHPKYWIIGGPWYSSHTKKIADQPMHHIVWRSLECPGEAWRSAKLPESPFLQGIEAQEVRRLTFVDPVSFVYPIVPRFAVQRPEVRILLSLLRSELLRNGAGDSRVRSVVPVRQSERVIIEDASDNVFEVIQFNSMPRQEPVYIRRGTVRHTS